MLGFVFFSDLFYFSFGMLASKKFLRAPRSFERKTSLRAEGSADSCRVSRSCSLLAAGFASLQGLAERALRSFGACRVPCFASLETGSAVLRGLQGPLLWKSWNGLCGPLGLAGSLALQVLKRALRSFGACRVPCFASLGTGSAVLWGLQGPLLCKSWNGLRQTSKPLKARTKPSKPLNASKEASQALKEASKKGASKASKVPSSSPSKASKPSKPSKVKGRRR